MQLGMCAFRHGMIKDAHDALMDVQSSGRSKDLLAQVCMCVCVCVVILSGPQATYPLIYARILYIIYMQCKRNI